jgi:hypothetical protein
VNAKYKIELPIAEQAQLKSCIKPDPKNGNWSPLSGDERTPKKFLTLRSDNNDEGSMVGFHSHLHGKESNLNHFAPAR